MQGGSLGFLVGLWDGMDQPLLRQPLSHKIVAVISDSDLTFPRYFKALAETCPIPFAMGAPWLMRVMFTLGVGYTAPKQPKGESHERCSYYRDHCVV